MGLFNLLFGRKPTSTAIVQSERIWLTQQAKWNGVQSAIDAFEQSDAVALLLVAHFDDTLETLLKAASAYQGQGRVAAILAEDLSPGLATKLQLDADCALDMTVAERHPLRSEDERLREFVASLPCRCRVTYHVSLEDTFFAKLGGNRTAQIVKSLGMQENEALDSAMVSRQIERAQRKIESQAMGNNRAPSAEEWWRKNMPGG
jgi:hypothetical protein